MSMDKATSYLSKELLIGRRIVTYRSLSRALSIHVNDAKNELATFLDTESPKTKALVATYLLSGEVSETREMEMDGEEIDDSEDVPQFKILLVSAADLEATKKKFTRLNSVHIYCLSPSPLKDAGLVCDLNDKIREKDIAGGSEYATKVGRVVGKDVVHRPVKAAPQKSKAKPAASTSAKPSKLETPKTEPSKSKEPEKPKPSSEKPAKPTTSGKVNTFFKSKAQQDKEKAEQEEKDKKAAKAAKAANFFNTGAKSSSIKKEKKPEEEEKPKSKVKVKQESRPPSRSASVVSNRSTSMSEASGSKRGTKRKSMPDSDAEEPPVTLSKPSGTSKKASGARAKKGVIIDSDEEDAVEAPRRLVKGKGKASTPVSNANSEDERNLRAMMDVDDAEVDRASRAQDNIRSDEAVNLDEDDEESQVAARTDEDVDMDDETAIAKPKRARKPKKVIPVGRNGLKKKRVMKTRTAVDEKGYMATEDYSDYESVSEEEAEPEKPKKSTAKGKESSKQDDEAGSSNAKKETKKVTKVKDKSPAPVAKKSSGSASKAKSASAKSSGKSGQKTMANFFAVAPKPKAAKA